MNEVIVTGDEDLPKGCCQNCGESLVGYVSPEHPWKRGPDRCDECPKCGVYPRWSSGKIDLEKRAEVTRCTTCREEFIQRIRYQTTEESCGDRRRTKVHRGPAWSICGACREQTSANLHIVAARRAQERAEQKRAQQRRGLAANARLAARHREIVEKNVEKSKSQHRKS